MAVVIEPERAELGRDCAGVQPRDGAVVGEDRVDVGGPDSEAVKAQKPLRDALVEVEDVEGNPGYYKAKFYLRPHYQLEGLTASLSLVSRLENKAA